MHAARDESVIILMILMTVSDITLPTSYISNALRTVALNMETPDAKLLKYIARRKTANTEDIAEKFGELRLDMLLKKGFVFAETEKEAKMVLGQPYREATGRYGITELGKLALEDCVSRRRDMWLKSLWIPVIVAFVTSVIANYLLPRLPLIRELFSSFRG